MTGDGLIFAVLLVGSVLLDRLARVRPPRLPGESPAAIDGKAVVGSGRRALSSRSAYWAGLWLQAWMTTALFGLLLALCGSIPVAAILALAMLALLVLSSNAKYALLGEPLLFSDLALIGAIFRHPQFYLSAVGIRQRIAVAAAAALLLAVIGRLFVPVLSPHLAGGALMLAALAVLAISMRVRPWRDLARLADADADVACLGFAPTLLLYWQRWREGRDPPPCADVARQPPAAPPAFLVIVQCESFADPVELFADPDLTLPGLAGARENAWQWGRLEVSGFGAYTMRTEYGVLFGRNEEELGFRRYDPFLTASGEASYALPARLRGWRSLFVHPHDMRFYGRDRIMPAGGFAQLVGEDRFAPPAPGEGRYVTDAAVAKEVLALVGAGVASGPRLVYAVTMENHGPWAPDGSAGGHDLVPGYLRLVRHGDAMLTTLLEGLAALAAQHERPAMLVFFGDHRPSIPGATAPGGDRHTPYVMMRLDAAGAFVRRGADARVDLTPAGLHHAMLEAVLGKVI